MFETISTNAQRARIGGHLIASVVFLVITLLVAASPTSDAIAQEQEGRTLGGYSFIPSNRVPDPFITTHFRNATGLGVANDVTVPILLVEQPPPAEPDTLLALKGDLLYVLVEAEYQQRFGDQVAVRLGVGGGSRLGTGVQSLLSQGVSAASYILAGTTVRLWSSDKWLVSGALDLGYGSSLRVDLLGWVEKILEDGVDANASISISDDGAIFDMGVRVAWAPKPYYGFTGLLDFGFTNAVQRQKRSHGEVALTGGIDFAQKGGAPIGVLGSFDYDGISRDGEDAGTSISFGLGVFYTGKEDFVVGLEATIEQLALENRDYDVDSNAFMLAMRYWF